MTERAQVLPVIDQELCTGCGQCVEACPSGALVLSAGRPHLADPETCSYCADCEDLCPQGAIGLPYEIGLDEGRAEPPGGVSGEEANRTHRPGAV